jgi:hypothetical protein
MKNHFHLVVETPQGNLVGGTGQTHLNSEQSQ